MRRFGQARPIKMEICRDRDRRPPTVQKAARSRYARLLERVLRREMPGWALDKARLSTSMDLERSFSPVYARGLLRKGRSAFAVMGVNQQETQASVDAALTFGLLWLDACREREAGRSVVEGLRLYVPPKTSATVQIRLAHLNHAAAKFQLFEFDERDESCNPDRSFRSWQHPDPPGAPPGRGSGALTLCRNREQGSGARAAGGNRCYLSDRDYLFGCTGWNLRE